jgi:hypothetical protein
MINIDELKNRVTQLTQQHQQRIEQLLMNDPVVQNISGQLTILTQIISQLEKDNEKK